MMETVSFRFTGNISDQHQLNFYECGRFQYGAARFIYTLEHFRQTGKVAQKLRKKINSDIRIQAAKEGSYLQEIIILSAPAIIECAIQCPYEIIFTYIWDKLIPSSEGKNIAIELAKQETKREEYRTTQEKERTKQQQVYAEVLNNTNATTQQALTILAKALEQNKQSEVNGELISINELKTFFKELTEEQFRKDQLSPYKEILDKIPPETEQRLASQLRNALSDIALPLRSSANNLELTTNNQINNPLASLDYEKAIQISSEKEDKLATIVYGSIKSFDREGCYGKIRYDDLLKPISFSVRTYHRELIHSKIIAAMLHNEPVKLKIYLVRDNNKTPIRAYLEDIIFDENNIN